MPTKLSALLATLLLSSCALWLMVACTAAPESAPTPPPVTDAPALATVAPSPVPPTLTPLVVAGVDSAENTPTPFPSATPTEPLPTPTVTPTVAIITYTVRTGDTLTSIASQFGTDIATIQRLNEMTDADFLSENQLLRVPQGGTLADLDPDLIPTPSVPVQLVGQSASGWPINAYTIGVGPRHVAIVGAIHGGYEWNSAVLAYDLLDYFSANPDAVPENVTLHIIPIANPDGIDKVIGGGDRFNAAAAPPNVDDTAPGRTNGNGVDLNRNWDCNWAPTAEWRYGPISPGDRAFSEPETQALKAYLVDERSEPLAAVVFLHSAAGIVAPGRCGEAEHQPSVALSGVYATAAGIYRVQYFTAYEVTGDASDWFADQGIPSFTVELTTHSAIEFDANLRGTLALLASIASDPYP